MSTARARRGGYTAAARLAGRKRAAALENLDLCLDQLDAIARTLGPEMNTLIRQAGYEAQRRAQSLATFGKSGRYGEGIRLKVFDEPDGSVTAKVFALPPVYPDRKQYGGRMPANFPLWIEYGTYKTPAKPHLIPAFEQARARLDSAVVQLLENRVKD